MRETYFTYDFAVDLVHMSASAGHRQTTTIFAGMVFPRKKVVFPPTSGKSLPTLLQGGLKK